VIEWRSCIGNRVPAPSTRLRDEHLNPPEFNAVSMAVPRNHNDRSCW